MILYHPKFGTELSEYGINLPLRDDRSSAVFEILKKNFPDLEPVALEEIDLLSLHDFLGSHGAEYIEKLSADETFLSEILKTYECLEGERYNPQNSSKPIGDLRSSIIRQVSATFHSLKEALDSGFCFFLGGGMHHGRIDRGGGFCPVNDIAIALKNAQRNNLIKNALVIDTDAHFGDGTAEVTANDPSIKTLSIHMKEGWPLGSDQKIVASDLDIEVAAGEEHLYLNKLRNGLEHFANTHFDCVIVVAGADPHEKDELMGTNLLNLTESQMLARDMLVYKWCKEREIPQLWLMAGGYGEYAPKIYAQFILKILHLMR